MKTYAFRIRKARGAWRVETYDHEPPYGPGWQPAYSGAPTVEDCRAWLAPASLLEWDDETRMAGRYTFA
jgi:hypothetical protein